MASYRKTFFAEYSNSDNVVQWYKLRAISEERALNFLDSMIPPAGYVLKRLLTRDALKQENPELHTKLWKEKSVN
jgi:hypothetical protein